MTNPRKPLPDVAFSEDGQSIVTASRDRTARIWRVKDGAELVILKGYRAGVSSAAFNPTGSSVVTTSSRDRTVRFFEVKSGREIAVLADQRDAADVKPALTHSAFSSDGSRNAVVSGDENARTIRVFPMPEDLIDQPRRVVPRELTSCERKRFFLPVAGEVGDCPADTR